MPDSCPPIYVVIPAAGIGRRMQSDIPKQYLLLGNQTVLEHTLDAFLCIPQIKQIILALHPEDDRFKQLPCNSEERVLTVKGGAERADSVLAGIAAIGEPQAWVMVHDAARPCVAKQDIDKLIAAINQQRGVILATPVTDTMKRTDANGSVLTTEKRDNLWHALTPQCFSLSDLKEALQTAKQDGVVVTDEASAMEYLGGEVEVIEGSGSNIKITRPDDLLLAQFYLSTLGRA